MKCPKCQAKLLPVDGVMFCLQCGNAVAFGAQQDRAGPALEETTDPLLRKAIVDAAHHPVTFRVPVAAAVVDAQSTKSSMVSMRSLLAAPVHTGGGAAVMMPATVFRSAPKDTLQGSVAHEGARVNLRPWLAGLVAFFLFVGANLLIDRLLVDRVYPGVRVGSTALGMTSFETLGPKLSKLSGPGALKLYIGNSSYSIAAGELGAIDTAEIERDVKAIGHNTPLPMAGLIEAMLSKPVGIHFVINQDEMVKSASNISRDATRPASDAVPMVVNGQVFAINDKGGIKVDEGAVEAALKKALPSGGSVSLRPEEVHAGITDSDYKEDLEAAQARVALSIQIKVRGVAHTATPGDIGSWLVFQGPGKGVVADESAVSGYFAQIAGKFDRAAAVNAVAQAVNAGTPLSYTASVAHVTVANGALSRQNWPLYTYTYCTKSAGSADELSQTAQLALQDSKGWGIGGRLRFSRADSGCMFLLQMVQAKEMANLDPACENHTTCTTGSRLLISTEAWNAVPAGWTGTLAGYHTELINHEVGHWLGFDHASCTGKATAPILEAPALTLNGCSPNWYSIPAEAQGTKPLAGF